MKILARITALLLAGCLAWAVLPAPGENTAGPIAAGENILQGGEEGIHVYQVLDQGLFRGFPPVILRWLWSRPWSGSSLWDVLCRGWIRLYMPLFFSVGVLLWQGERQPGQEGGLESVSLLRGRIVGVGETVFWEVTCTGSRRLCFAWVSVPQKKDPA